eukprot:CAMPEP_0115208420 /NCGR_PEP_ID=MMETSP0270-20121206/21217_1 /TAXON_ID=71861 /ORGANISM="Scrippsiella trochoidea, Strain CCMP3099" /LENGTH=117 /DNA_ID=CAMNT_0002622033 /DNA_START=295 /DNA_END=649 /DNA_ORIENTATION=+
MEDLNKGTFMPHANPEASNHYGMTAWNIAMQTKRMIAPSLTLPSHAFSQSLMKGVRLETSTRMNCEQVPLEDVSALYDPIRPDDHFPGTTLGILGQLHWQRSYIAIAARRKAHGKSL